MRHPLTKLSTMAAILGLAASVQAVEFQPLGFESVSMGGAGVASSRGSFAAYFNPAALALHTHSAEISITGGVGIREINLAEHIDKLGDVKIQDTINALKLDTLITSTSTGISQQTRDNITTIKEELTALSSQNGIQLMPNASVGIQAGAFGFGAYGISEATGYAVIDPDRLEIIVENTHPIVGATYVNYDEATDTFSLKTQSEYEAQSLEYALNQGLTYLQLTGLVYVEIPVGYGYKIATGAGNICVGASAKIMPAYTYEKKIQIDTKSGEISDNLDNGEKRDTSWGVDVGVLYQPAVAKGLSIGMVGKNLNEPSFDTVSGGEIKVKRQMRAGLAYNLWGDRLTLAADMDLTRNETFIPNYDSKYLGGGFNFHPASWFSLRGGAMKNLEDSNDGTIFTAGLGFGLKWLQIDVSSEMSNKKANYDGNEIPRYLKGQVALVSKWS